MVRFESIGSALQALRDLEVRPLHSRRGWDVPHVLHHYAQSIEYSMHGFPVLKPGWFRATLGPLAFAVFSWRGRMSHGLTEAIPGAPEIAEGQPLHGAVARAAAAMQTFEGYGGVLKPHFAYGALDKVAYTQAHLMHLANHWALFDA